ncbi:hypothetical protein CS063_02355 [Sporanaerobium hydrogeniformans]|uniref:Uncharacterized protein n=1 Tax=Sporanaerobium hydrogeniformans TaxID=3072179 RepID=A0AC61DGH1_9FIRM|nr:prepilin-type N-terminal cleavage/methylation domain-containing protein [Sporanaerobium hydrogeniformans]PHV72339.1 hypothetical protein CS063_02355 [Sporanaerobium hydrogeniformans]
MKTRNQKGFSLLEAVLALLLFTLLLEGLFDFFAKTYAGYVYFDHKATNINEARVVSDFIRREIREADEVAIHLMDTTVITRGNMEGVTGSTLKQIMTTSAGMGLRTLKLEANATTEGARYKLSYNSGGRTALVSNQIEDIIVRKATDSQLISFQCKIYKKNQNYKSQRMESTFTENLYYKE